MINNYNNINHKNLIENIKQPKDDKHHVFRKYEGLFYTKCRVTSNGFMFDPAFIERGKGG
jgi:hypothetical protein